jgi:hypothetical protein
VLNIFPNCQECDYMVLDLLGDRSRHPVDMRNQTSDLLAAGWRVADGQHGFLVLQQGAEAGTHIPDSFYSFTSPAGEPEYRVGIVFGDQLELVGFDLFWDYWGRPAVRLYWRALQAPEIDWQPAALITDRDGMLRATPDTHTPVILLWYPASRWQPGETYVVEMLPFDAPDEVLISAGVGAPLVESGTRLKTAEGQDLVPLAWLERHFRGWRIKPVGSSSKGQDPLSLTAPQSDARDQTSLLPFTHNSAWRL